GVCEGCNRAMEALLTHQERGEQRADDAHQRRHDHEFGERKARARAATGAARLACIHAPGLHGSSVVKPATRVPRRVTQLTVSVIKSVLLPLLTTMYFSVMLRLDSVVALLSAIDEHCVPANFSNRAIAAVAASVSLRDSPSDRVMEPLTPAMAMSPMLRMDMATSS